MTTDDKRRGAYRAEDARVDRIIRFARSGRTDPLERAQADTGASLLRLETIAARIAGRSV